MDRWMTETCSHYKESQLHTILRNPNCTLRLLSPERTKRERGRGLSECKPARTWCASVHGRPKQWLRYGIRVLRILCGGITKHTARGGRDSGRCRARWMRIECKHGGAFPWLLFRRAACVRS